MMTSDDKVGGWVKKGQNHDDVILEWSLSQKSKKLSHHFRVCFELGFGILNAPRGIFWVVSGPQRELRGLQGVEFQGKNCFTKMVSNFSEINFGFA